MERASEEVRYAVIGVPFLRISFHTLIPGQVAEGEYHKKRVRSFFAYYGMNTNDNINQTQMNSELRIPAGGMYQEWMSLIDLLEPDKAEELERLAANNGWREVQPKEALDMGFEELVNWSKPETDVHVLVGDDYFVCLNKSALK